MFIAVVVTLTCLMAAYVVAVAVASERGSDVDA